MFNYDNVHGGNAMKDTLNFAAAAVIAKLSEEGTKFPQLHSNVLSNKKKLAAYFKLYHHAMAQLRSNQKKGNI